MTDLETLRQLRDAAKPGPWETKSILGIPYRISAKSELMGKYDSHVVNYTDGVDTYDVLESADANDCAFIAAAHAALGPEGCVTKELENLREHITRLEEIITDDCNPLIESLEAERDSLQRAVKDAQKENRYLLDRLVKLSAPARDVRDCACLWNNDDGDSLFEAIARMAAVLEEMPPR